MARVATEIKRLFVRILAKSVEDAEFPSLQDALLALAAKQFKLIENGQILVSSTADGYSGSFSLPNPGSSGGLSLSSIAELSSELLDLRDKADAFLTKVAKYGLDADTVDDAGWPSPLPAVVDPDPTIADSDIATRMLTYLVPTFEARCDFTHLEQGGGTWY